MTPMGKSKPRQDLQDENSPASTADQSQYQRSPQPMSPSPTAGGHNPKAYPQGAVHPMAHQHAASHQPNHPMNPLNPMSPVNHSVPSSDVQAGGGVTAGGIEMPEVSAANDFGLSAEADRKARMPTVVNPNAQVDAYNREHRRHWKEMAELCKIIANTDNPATQQRAIERWFKRNIRVVIQFTFCLMCVILGLLLYCMLLTSVADSYRGLALHGGRHSEIIIESIYLLSLSVIVFKFQSSLNRLYSYIQIL